MAFTKAQLRAELLTDSVSLGYAPFVASNNDMALADLINDKTKGGNIDKTKITAAELQSCVVATEGISLSVAQSTLWQHILIAAADGGVLLSDSQIRNQILLVFTANGAGTTKSKINALQQRPGSRAEALWGEGTTVSAGDVSHALRDV
jgi:hypothetical protein